MKYPDTVILVNPVIGDAYGSEKIGRQETVKANVGQVTGYTQADNSAVISSDSTAYLDPTNSYVLEMVERLEGMLLITSFGETQADAWYRIETVSVGKRGLLNNKLDNVLVNLKKTTPIVGVS